MVYLSAISLILAHKLQLGGVPTLGEAVSHFQFSALVSIVNIFWNLGQTGLINRLHRFVSDLAVVLEWIIFVRNGLSKFIDLLWLLNFVLFNLGYRYLVVFTAPGRVGAVDWGFKSGHQLGLFVLRHHSLLEAAFLADCALHPRPVAIEGDHHLAVKTISLRIAEVLFGGYYHLHI